jgi:hypothetical protein
LAVSGRSHHCCCAIISISSNLAKKDPSEIIAASKLREPYRRKWKPVRGLTHARPDTATSIEIRQLVGQMYCDVHPICAFYQESTLHALLPLTCSFLH